jgi:hypothetical protein
MCNDKNRRQNDVKSSMNLIIIMCTINLTRTQFHKTQTLVIIVYFLLLLLYWLFITKVKLSTFDVNKFADLLSKRRRRFDF